MPNYATNRCTVHGSAEDISAFEELMIREAEDKTYETEVFDFKRIIPMPEILTTVHRNAFSEDFFHIISRSSNMRYSWERVDTNCAGRLGPMEDGLDKSEEEIKAILRDVNPEALSQAELMKEALDTTGFASWYDWSIKNWGTKWNSRHFQRLSDDPLVFRFDTAWSPPSLVFEALAERFPNLHIHCSTFEEGWGYAADGWFNPPDGESEYGLVEPDDEMYEKVYGVPPEMSVDNEDDEDDEVMDEGQILGDGSEDDDDGNNRTCSV